MVDNAATASNEQTKRELFSMTCSFSGVRGWKADPIVERSRSDVEMGVWASALLAQGDEVIERFRCRDVLD